MHIVRHGLLALVAALACQGMCLAGNSSEPVGDPVLEPATLRCLGAYWVIKGDDNKNAKVEVSYRKVGTQDWKAGPPLMRVSKGANKDRDIKLAADDWLFAGSVIDIPEATDYELRLKLVDPDGGTVEKTLKAHTIAEPVDPVDGPTYHVVPGNGGGSGTKEDPFKGLAAADAAAKPGDTFLVHAGKYEGQWTLTRSGEEGKPIVWRGAGDGDTILETTEKIPQGTRPPGDIVNADGKHDVWFEHLTTQGDVNADFSLHNAYRIVIRRCHIIPCMQGIYGTKNDSSKMGQFFISDNVIDGRQPWPATAAQWGTPHGNPDFIFENRGVWIGGSGNVVCFNRVHNTKDGIDTAEYGEDAKHPDKTPLDFAAEVAVDFHNNDISNCYDDGCEMDGSYRNCRNFLNRYVNTLTGISFQPVEGGPVYAVRNVVYNTKSEFLKLHNSPSGVVVIHNTFVHKGQSFHCTTPAACDNIYLRNNLFVGTEGAAMKLELPMKTADIDYDGYAGVSGTTFMKYTLDIKNYSFATSDEVRAKSPLEKHHSVIDAASLFASGVKLPDYLPTFDYKTKPGSPFTTGMNVYKPETIDLRLNPRSNAAGAGEPLPGFNNAVAGKVELGAYPVGSELPQYGPRPEKK